MPTSGFILLVEDDRDVRESMQEALQDEGYEVLGAVDGLDALQHLRNATTLPDLVLLDLMMPRMSGAELRDAISKVPEWAGIPIIILSADSQIRSKAAALQVTGYLEKPIKLATLFNKVASAVAGSAG